MTLKQAKEAIREMGRYEFEALLNDMGEDVVMAGIEAGIDVSSIEEAYNGEWRSDVEFVQDLLESIGTIPSDLPYYVYIDWERTARDVMMGYTEQDGHYFSLL